jgi:hypothetical protein
MFFEILIQAGYYFIAMIIGVLLISLMQRGMFWQIIKVRLSFGKLVLVKLRQVHRDYFSIGKIQDGFLVFGEKKQERRIAIPDNKFFYRLSGLICVDVHDEKNALCSPDYSAVPGFDAIKYNNLYIRTLFQPTVTDNQDKIIMGALVLIVILIVGVGFLVYKNGYSLEFILGKVNDLISSGGVISK